MILPLDTNPASARSRECKGLADFHRRRAEEPTLPYPEDARIGEVVFDLAPDTLSLEQALRQAIEEADTGMKLFRVVIEPCEGGDSDDEQVVVQVGRDVFQCDLIDFNEDHLLIYQVYRQGVPDEQEVA